MVNLGNRVLQQFHKILAPFKAMLAPFRKAIAVPLKILGTPKKMIGMSLPVRAALITFLLMITVIGLSVWIYSYANQQEAVPLSDRVPLLLVACMFTIAITICVWYMVKLFLDGNISAFPKIDAAWEAGLQALEKNGIDITRVPVFVILGTRGGGDTDNLLDACNVNLLVRGEPEGRKPLRWYANERAVFIACVETGCLSLVNKHFSGEGSPIANGGDESPTSTISPGGTLRPGEPQAEFGESSDPNSEEPQMGLFGTLVAGIESTIRPGADAANLGGSPTSSGNRLSKSDLQAQWRRLQHVAQLLRRVRQPYCPHNGILTLIPWDVIHKDAMSASLELSDAVRTDVDCFSNTTKLHAPITALVTGMESEQGFMELIRRVGSSHRQARFGKGFDVGNATTRHNMEALAAHARGAYEDWVYQLFKAPNGLAEVGNRDLYGLLCKIRSQLSSRLKNMMCNGFGRDPNSGRNLLSGLYFAATGATVETQCFVKGVIDKMVNLEEEVGWIDQARRQDLFYQRLAQFIMFVNFVIVCGGLFVLFRFRPGG